MQKKLLTLIRNHWGAIENGLHWVRDEVMGEDRSTIFCGHARRRTSPPSTRCGATITENRENLAQLQPEIFATLR